MRKTPPKTKILNPKSWRWLVQMGVSKNKGTPKWWFIMEHLIKMDDLGVTLFSETSR